MAGRHVRTRDLRAQLSGLQRAHGYERLRNRISPEQARDFLENIEVAAIMVGSLGQVAFSSDPDDNIILATASAGGADLIVSGDKPGMLSIGAVEGIKIVTPREALDRLEASR